MTFAVFFCSLTKNVSYHQFIQHFGKTHKNIDTLALIFTRHDMNRTKQLFSTHYRLVMCSNSLTGKGLCALAKSLAINSVLKQLYIWGNDMDIAACQVFLIIYFALRVEETSFAVLRFLSKISKHFFVTFNFYRLSKS